MAAYHSVDGRGKFRDVHLVMPLERRRFRHRPNDAREYKHEHGAHDSGQRVV